MTSRTRRQSALSATEYTLLGLTAGAEGTGPVHGYDLARQLPSSSLAHVIRIEPGMIYHYLKRLAERGLLTAEIDAKDGRPARHLYTLTPEGRSRLETWMVEPVPTTREIRLEFLLKLWFARQHPERASRLIDDQRRVIDDHIDSLNTQIDALSADDGFGRLVLALRAGQNRAIRQWLEQLESDA